jgi:hypothetical protein
MNNDVVAGTSVFGNVAAPRPRNGLERFFRIPRLKLAEQGLRRLFAQVERPSHVSSNDIAQTFQDYGILLRRRQALRSVFRTALDKCVSDDLLSEAEVNYLTMLRGALGLKQKEVEQAEAAVVHPRFAKALAEVLSDQHISPEERGRLKQLQTGLRISDGTRAALSKLQLEPIVKNKVGDIVADKRVSPDEQKELAEMCKNLGVDLTISDPTLMARYALFWMIENGQAPVLTVGIALQKGETCHYEGAAAWKELRTRTRTVGYSGFSTSIRIMKGVSYRTGTVRPQRVTTEQLETVDTGRVYITNKRVIFDGSRKNSAWRYSSLIGARRYSDAIELEKTSGRNPVLYLEYDLELASVLLAAMMVND